MSATAPGRAYHRPVRRLIACAAVAATILSSSTAGAATGVLEGAFAPPGYSNSAFGGSLCPCEPIPYNNFPGGQTFIDAGAVELDKWITTHAGAGPLLVAGHSEGGQVVYAWINTHAGDPAPPDVSFVTFGNPARKYGGIQAGTLPADQPYPVTDVARQYDGAADWPTDTSNGLAVLNALAGLLFVHPFYGEVNLADPRNAVWTEGNVTYVLAPTDTLPLLMPIAWLGPQTIAALDASLRPQIEAAYDRPVAFPTPTTTAPIQAAAETPTLLTSTATAETSIIDAGAPSSPKRDTVKPPPSAAKPARTAEASRPDATPDTRHERKQRPWHARNENHPTATLSRSAPTAPRTHGTRGSSDAQPGPAAAGTGRPRTK